MNVVRPPARSLSAGALVIGALACLLSACVSVFPKESPAQLYRFGGTVESTGGLPPPSAASFTVQAAPTGFDRAAASDAILTITGNQAAYIKGSRWVASAASLFDSAVTNAFDAHGGAARLIPRGEASRPDYLLKIDVRSFEARYDHGQQVAPTVVVEVYAALTRAADRAPSGERIFQAAVPAADNRAGPIAAAFDKAARKVLGDLVGWVDAKGAT
jgi:cholesterol transport system auxiliary component